MPKPNKTETITKEKIASHLQNHMGLSILTCEEIVSEMFKSAVDIIEEYDKLLLKNFGTLKIKHKKERPGFNIKAGDPVSISARNVLSFTPSRHLKKKINCARDE